jgi:hypothetical protein
MSAELLQLVAGRPELVLAAGTLVAVVAAVQWRKARQTEAELAFKAEMLERGVPVEEIARLLAPGPPSARGILEQFGALSGGAKAGLIIGVVLMANMVMCATIAVNEASRRPAIHAPVWVAPHPAGPAAASPAGAQQASPQPFEPIPPPSRVPEGS